MKGILFKPWKHEFIRQHPDMELQIRRVIKPQPIIRKGVMRWEKSKTIDINMDDHADLAIPYASYQEGEVV
jgi:hypothetical protein